MSSDETQQEDAPNEATTELYSDSEISEMISRASGGSLNAAWLLIHQIKTALEDRTLSEPLFNYAAAFFEALLVIENSSERGSTPRELAQAFAKLHIVRERGQPMRLMEETYELAAHVFLLKQAGFSTDFALTALESLEGHKRKAFRSAAEKAEPAFEQITTEELEALSGKTQMELLDALVGTGAITESHKKAAVKEAAETRAGLRAQHDMIANVIKRLRSAKK